MGDSNDGSGGGKGSDDVYKGRTESTLVLLSDLYSDDNSISVCDSRPSSCSAYTITDYYYPNKKVYNVDLRRSFYSKQGFKNTCYSSV